MNLFVAITLWLWLATTVEAYDLRVRVDSEFEGRPLVFDSFQNRTVSGQEISVTRADFLLSNVALRQANGIWLGLTNWVAFIGARDGQNEFYVRNIPAASYDRLRVSVGLRPDLNHGDPAGYPSDHPLNPVVNGLHWNWRGGYVFLALEGKWRTAGGKESGYSFHLASDENLCEVELPLTLNLHGNAEARLKFDLAKLFGGYDGLSQETASTHSRAGDERAHQLVMALKGAFAFKDDSTPMNVKAPAGNPRIELAPSASFFKLKISTLFPQPDLPKDNPLTEEGVELGRRLFFERMLSINNSQSCASCHHTDRALAENQRVSKGAYGNIGGRNAMALFNLAWKKAYFWDGRASTLRDQVLQPIQNPIEMHETLPRVVAKLRTNEGYPNAFERAFGRGEITADKIARALEQFLITQIAQDSKFDLVLRGEQTFSAQEQKGFELFNTEYDPRREQFGADCFHCHGGPLFQSASFANNGLDTEFSDAGRYNVTKKEGDLGKFAIPSLRNVELTAPYMHDGRFKTLEEVIEHYSTGVKPSSTLDPNLAKHPDGGVPLTAEDKSALVAFLRTLTDKKSER